MHTSTLPFLRTSWSKNTSAPSEKKLWVFCISDLMHLQILTTTKPGNCFKVAGGLLHFLCCGPPPSKKKFENHCCSEFKECVEFTTVTETHRIELGLQITPQDRIYGFVTSGQSFIWNPIPGHTDVSESLRMRSDQINHKTFLPTWTKHWHGVTVNIERRRKTKTSSTDLVEFQ